MIICDKKVSPFTGTFISRADQEAAGFGQVGDNATFPGGAPDPDWENRLRGLGGSEEDDKNEKLKKKADAIELLRTTLASFGSIVKEFGPEGEAYAAMMDGMFGDNEGSLLNTMGKLVEGGQGAMGTLSALGGVIGSIGNIMAQSSKMAVAEIDNQIKAEKNRDGSSKESLDKIKQMEAKKIEIQRKAFETKKKLAIAQTMISITTAVVKAWEDYGWPWGAVLGAMIAAMGMKQISIIKSQQ